MCIYKIARKKSSLPSTHLLIFCKILLIFPYSKGSLLRVAVVASHHSGSAYRPDTVPVVCACVAHIDIKGTSFGLNEALIHPWLMVLPLFLLRFYAHVFISIIVEWTAWQSGRLVATQTDFSSPSIPPLTFERFVDVWCAVRYLFLFVSILIFYIIYLYLR